MILSSKLPSLYFHIYIAAKNDVPSRNRSYNYSLGARIHHRNTYNYKLIQVKESLDFSNYFINLCQNKKTQFHLCKTVLGACPVLGAPKGFNHSVHVNSYIWLPFLHKSATVITLFPYYTVYEVGCRCFLTIIHLFLHLFLQVTSNFLHQSLPVIIFYIFILNYSRLYRESG